MSVATLDLADLKRHIGRTDVTSDVVTATQANLLRLTFARPEPELKDGDVLPPGWHVIYFTPRVGAKDLRPDGTPAHSAVMPDMPLPGGCSRARRCASIARFASGRGCAPRPSSRTSR